MQQEAAFDEFRKNCVLQTSPPRLSNCCVENVGVVGTCFLVCGEVLCNRKWADLTKKVLASLQTADSTSKERMQRKMGEIEIVVQVVNRLLNRAEINPSETNVKAANQAAKRLEQAASEATKRLEYLRGDRH